MVGFLLGHSALDLIGSQIDYLGPICFIIYGIYILWFAPSQQTEENNHWLIWGLPMSFSLDNFVAGAGLGLLAYPPIISAMILGLMSSLLAWLGLRMGALLVHKLATRAERITGVIFIVVAISLFIDQG
jgi:putative Mn2+ efflux pump MntP